MSSSLPSAARRPDIEVADSIRRLSCFLLEKQNERDTKPPRLHPALLPPDLMPQLIAIQGELPFEEIDQSGLLTTVLASRDQSVWQEFDCHLDMLLEQSVITCEDRDMLERLSPTRGRIAPFSFAGAALRPSPASQSRTFASMLPDFTGLRGTAWQDDR